MPIQVAVTIEQAEKGWVAFAAEARATAQGSTEHEALENLVSLFRTYPDLLRGLREADPRL